MQWNTKHLLSYFIFFNLTLCSFSYEIIIKYKPTTNSIYLQESQIKAAYSFINSARSMSSSPVNMKILEVNEIDKDSILEKLNNDPTVEYAQPNYQAKLLLLPNDSKYISDSDYRGLFSAYRAQDAWDISTGSSQVIVAVLDTGIDTNHPDLIGRCLTQDWKNYIFPVSTPEDDHGHGTHVAGIIGANGNNVIGVTGLNWNCKLLPIKVLNSSGTGSLSSVVDGIYYAVQKGAKVINLSVGFSDFIGDSLQDAIDYAYSHGVCIVVAAGNDNEDISAHKVSPVCNDGNSNKVFGVAALHNDKTKASYSNYSDKYVDISAFGGEWPNYSVDGILSTYIGDTYTKLSGTSMAAPAISGIISLLLSLAPNLSPAQVMDYLSLTEENIDTINVTYAGKLGVGLVQAYDLLQLYQGTQSSTQNTDEILQFYNYPNPVDSSVVVENSTTFYAEFTKPISNASIGIYSITGRKVHEINILQSSSTVLYQSWNLGNGANVLPSGVYIAVLKVRISGKELIKYQKVLIK
jgi:subtilisin family serine protease